jgi:Na+-translocating ferredoxin:NAD+ oxidoreductase RnfG subunit
MSNWQEVCQIYITNTEESPGLGPKEEIEKKRRKLPFTQITNNSNKNSFSIFNSQ